MFIRRSKDYLSLIKDGIHSAYIEIDEIMDIEFELFDNMNHVIVEGAWTLGGEETKYDYLSKNVSLLKDAITKRELTMYQRLARGVTNFNSNYDVVKNKIQREDLLRDMADINKLSKNAENQLNELIGICNKSLAIIGNIKKGSWIWPFSSHNITDSIMKLRKYSVLRVKIIETLAEENQYLRDIRDKIEKMRVKLETELAEEQARHSKPGSGKTDDSFFNASLYLESFFGI